MTQLAFGTVAPTSRRAVAYIIDALIVAGLGIVLGTLLIIFAVLAGADGMLGVLAVGGPVIWLLLVGWLIIYTVMQSGKGSIGMRAQGLRLARDSDGAPLSFGMTLLRNIIFWLAACIVVGYFTPLFDGSGRFQGWHDKVAKSVMLDARVTAPGITAPPAQAVPVPPRPPVPGQQMAAPVPGSVSAEPAAPSSYAPPAYAAPSYPAPAYAPAEAAPAVPTPEYENPAPAAPVAAQPAPPAFDVDDGSLIAFVPGITQDAPPAARAPEPLVTENADSFDIEDTRISIPGHRLVFTWDDGTRVTVSRRTLFGRNPAPEEGAVAVAVRDETLSLSKTHFEAAAEVSGGWITDRHSTNGTVVVRDGERIACSPGERVRIRLGDAIEIGDRIVTIGGYA